MRRLKLGSFQKVLQYSMPVIDGMLGFLAVLVSAAYLPNADALTEGHYRLFMFIFPLLLPSWLAYFGVYRSRADFSIVDEVARITLAVGVLFGLLTAVAFLTKTGALYSRGWALLSFVSSVLLLAGVRLAWLVVIQQLLIAAIGKKKILILGASSGVSRLKARLEAGVNSKVYHVETLATANLGDDELNDQLVAMIECGNVDQLWVHSATSDMDWLASLRKLVAPFSIEVYWVPDFEGVHLLSQEVRKVAGLHLVNLQHDPLSGPRGVVKFVEDKVIALVAVVLLLPVYLVIGLVVAIESPGPVLFRQVRHGWNGRPISVYKFRTMVEHKRREGLIESAVLNDPRLTRIGAFLRKYSLDELPQFINVLQGRMSIVGPRPHEISQRALFESQVPTWAYRYRVKPGITGWAQVNGYRGQITDIEALKKRVEYDVYYVENWTLWMDIKIILLTALKGWAGPKAY